MGYKLTWDRVGWTLTQEERYFTNDLVLPSHFGRFCPILDVSVQFQTHAFDIEKLQKYEWKISGR